MQEDEIIPGKYVLIPTKLHDVYNFISHFQQSKWVEMFYT